MASMAPLSASTLTELKSFLSKASLDPQLLHDPSLGFLVAFVRELGGKVPHKTAPKATAYRADDACADLRDEGCVETPDEATQQVDFPDKAEPSEQVRRVSSERPCLGTLPLLCSRVPHRTSRPPEKPRPRLPTRPPRATGWLQWSTTRAL